VNALQAQYKFTPLGAWGKPYTPPTNVPVNSKVNVNATPPNQVAAMDAGMILIRQTPAARRASRGRADRAGPAIQLGKDTAWARFFDIDQIGNWSLVVFVQQRVAAHDRCKTSALFDACHPHLEQSGGYHGRHSCF
jgi:hypothetical protein